MRLTVVQALDGRWNYGPLTLERAMKREETGLFMTNQEAVNAAQRALQKAVDAGWPAVDRHGAAVL